MVNINIRPLGAQLQVQKSSEPDPVREAYDAVTRAHASLKDNLKEFGGEKKSTQINTLRNEISSARAWILRAAASREPDVLEGAIDNIDKINEMISLSNEGIEAEDKASIREVKNHQSSRNQFYAHLEKASATALDEVGKNPVNSAHRSIKIAGDNLRMTSGEFKHRKEEEQIAIIRREMGSARRWVIVAVDSKDQHAVGDAFENLVLLDGLISTLDLPVGELSDWMKKEKDSYRTQFESVQAELSKGLDELDLSPDVLMAQAKRRMAQGGGDSRAGSSKSAQPSLKARDTDSMNTLLVALEMAAEKTGFGKDEANVTFRTLLGRAFEKINQPPYDHEKLMFTWAAKNQARKFLAGLGYDADEGEAPGLPSNEESESETIRQLQFSTLEDPEMAANEVASDLVKSQLRPTFLSLMEKNEICTSDFRDDDGGFFVPEFFSERLKGDIMQEYERLHPAAKDSEEFDFDRNLLVAGLDDLLTPAALNDIMAGLIRSEKGKGSAG